MADDWPDEEIEEPKGKGKGKKRKGHHWNKVTGSHEETEMLTDNNDAEDSRTEEAKKYYEQASRPWANFKEKRNKDKQEKAKKELEKQREMALQNAEYALELEREDNPRGQPARTMWEPHENDCDAGFEWVLPGMHNIASP